MTNDVLVTGATGLQGGAVVDALLAAKIPVHALVRGADELCSARLSTEGEVSLDDRRFSPMPPRSSLGWPRPLASTAVDHRADLPFVN